MYPTFWRTRSVRSIKIKLKVADDHDMQFNDAYWINLASLKMIDFWRKNGAHAIFGSNKTEIFYGNSGDYYLSIGKEKSKNLSYQVYFQIMYFWSTFLRENGRGHHAGPKECGAWNPTKKLLGPLRGTFGSTFISKTCYQNFQTVWTPLPLKQFREGFALSNPTRKTSQTPNNP